MKEEGGQDPLQVRLFHVGQLPEEARHPEVLVLQVPSPSPALPGSPLLPHSPSCHCERCSSPTELGSHMSRYKASSLPTTYIPLCSSLTPTSASYSSFLTLPLTLPFNSDILNITKLRNEIHVQFSGLGEIVCYEHMLSHFLALCIIIMWVKS